ncbi:MAG: Hsp33 family molecular chaperone HslO [Desulfobacteraceae bacterium]|nr:Hsp33 family molecular chaperone HslO [Desulfobacteraceae bacterium]
MLNESRLYTFIDQEKKFALYFLEGQKLIQDMVLTHNLKPGPFACFRSTALSVQLMLGLLKQGEYFCFYVDSETPYFRLKIEMSADGLMRGMLYSDELNLDALRITGQVRLLKFPPHGEMPYQSTIELREVSMDGVINQVLAQSYKVNSRIWISEDSDQGFMLHQLPLSPREEPSNLKAAFEQTIAALNAVMAKAMTDPEAIRMEFQRIGFKCLADRKVRFACGCSKKQMVENLMKFIRTSGETLFSPGEDAVELVCEYCKKAYRITKKDLREHSSA